MSVYNSKKIFYSTKLQSGYAIVRLSLSMHHLLANLAIRVFPVPGGPNNNIPFTCFIPVHISYNYNTLH